MMKLKSLNIKKILTVMFKVLIVIFGVLLLLYLFGGIAYASNGLVDDKVSKLYEYSKYPISHYELDFYNDTAWDWLPTNWGDAVGKQIAYAVYVLTNIIWWLSLLISKATGYLVEQAFTFDFIDKVASKLGGNIQALAGVTPSGFDSQGFYPRMLLILLTILAIYLVYVGLFKRETTKAMSATIHFVLIFLITTSIFAYAPTYIAKLNDVSKDMSETALQVGTKIVLSKDDVKGKDSTKLIRDSLHGIQIKTPWLLLQYGQTDEGKIGKKRIEGLLKYASEDNKRQEIVKEETKENDNDEVKNKYMTSVKVPERLGTVLFLFVFNILISIFVILLCMVMLFAQILFILYSMFLPIAFLLGMIPSFNSKVREAVTTLFNTILIKIGITLVLSIAFSLSAMLYSLSSDSPFFLIAVLQILVFGGIFFKLNDLIQLVTLDGGQRQQAASSRIMRMFMGHQLFKRFRHKEKQSSSSSSGKDSGNGSKSRTRIGTSNNEKRNRQPLSSRVGERAGVIADAKNNVSDTVGEIKDSVQNAPTNFKYNASKKVEQVKRAPVNFANSVGDTRRQREIERKERREQKQNVLNRRQSELAEKRAERKAHNDAKKAGIEK